MLTHWAGREKKKEKRMVSPAGCSGSQGPAMAHIPFRKEDLRKPWSLGAKVGWPHFCLSCHLRRGFARSQSPGQICGSTMVKWGKGKKGRKGLKENGILGFRNPTMAKEEDRTEGQPPQHRQRPREHNSLPCQFTALTPPLWQISWAANGPQKVSSFNHTQHPVCTTITFWILQNPGLFQRYNLGNKYSPPRSCIKLL